LKTDDAKARLREISGQDRLGWVAHSLLHSMGINIDKDELDFSMGDYLAYLSRGIPWADARREICSRRECIVRPLFPFYNAVICLALYGLMDLLTIRPAKGPARLSTVGMLQIWHFFLNGIVYESLDQVLHLLIRNFAQTLLIYVLMLTPARLLHREPRAIRAPHVALLQRSS